MVMKILNSTSSFDVFKAPARQQVPIFLWFLICDFRRGWYLRDSYLTLIKGLWGFIVRQAPAIPNNVHYTASLLARCGARNLRLETNIIQLYKSTLHFTFSDFFFFFVMA
jgi:hypothetical protein